MKNEIFLDTAYAIALSSSKDQYHERAVSLAERLEKAGTHLVTTRAVQLEIGNALSKQRYRHAATQLLEALETDPTVEIFPYRKNFMPRHCGCTVSDRTKNGG